MSLIALSRPKRKFLPPRSIVYVVAAVIVLTGAYFLIPHFEWKAPKVKISPDSDAIGLSPIEVDVTEQGTGLKSVTVTLSAGGTEYQLAAERYDQPVMQKKLNVALSSKLAGVKEGPAVFRVSARDRSWWNFFRGNETAIQRNVTIDITPPTIELIADDPYISFGGSGLIIYKPSPDTVTSGVKIGKYFFPGYKAHSKDPAAYLAFFAHPYDVPENEKAVLVATDKAGNSKQLALTYTLKDVRYRKSTIAITDEFIQNKVAPLLNDVGARQGSPKEVFIKVNRDLRRENEEKIRTVSQKTAGSMLWSGPFSQLTNSKVEANFADARTYTYQDEVIDHAYHLGFDLSVTKRYPVEAANSGVVSFVGDLGIYGNTVIIDHGLGLSTLYAHLSSIEVKVDDQVKQQQVIGRTGETGLAVGDHLHFTTILNGVPVLPLEWWDKKWIKDNIHAKLDPSSAETDGQEVKLSKPRRKARR